MLHVIHQDVLGLDVAVGDREHGEVVQASKDLIGIDLDQNRIDLSLLYDLVEVIRKVVHYYIQVLIFSLIGKEAVLHHQVVGMFEHFEDLVLTIFVFFILKNFLNCNFLSSGSIDSEVDHTESTLSGHSFYFVLRGR